jgi:hypothetical protein
MAISGSCLCGGVRFELTRLTGPFEICHCNRCRKVTGAQGLPGIGANPADYTLVAGEYLIGSYSAPILYRPPAYTIHFCRNCGSPVPEPDPGGDFMEIPAGLLDSEPEIKPDKHIFVEHTPDWDDIHDDLPRLTMEELIDLRKGDT